MKSNSVNVVAFILSTTIRYSLVEVIEASLPIGKELKYSINGINPKYKIPQQRKNQHKKDLKNPNVQHDKN